MRALFSIYVWVVWLLHLFVLGPIALLFVAIDPRGAGFKLVKWGSWSALRLAGIRVVARGLERVDWAKPQVFMGNHLNLLDPFALCIVVPQHLAGVEKAENLKIPVYGWLSRAWGNIAIQREDKANAHAGIASATDRLKSGASILILPEGTRSKDGAMGPFKKGGFHMALDAGADILPFAFNGSFEILRNGDWKVYPGTIEIVFGESVPTAGYTKESLGELVETVRGAIAANLNG
ncbi:MAG: (acyl)-sn-glycerol-3-phosphate acyltransferase [Cyanobacteria bacterium RYN_339]|nr:(acyl)-sn-glycerol-3-phosphate acyltransferase [Cyanobacteria bacterium RYN_339]